MGLSKAQAEEQTEAEGRGRSNSLAEVMAVHLLLWGGMESEGRLSMEAPVQRASLAGFVGKRYWKGWENS